MHSNGPLPQFIPKLKTAERNTNTFSKCLAILFDKELIRTTLLNSSYICSLANERVHHANSVKKVVIEALERIGKLDPIDPAAPVAVRGVLLA